MSLRRNAEQSDDRLLVETQGRILTAVGSACEFCHERERSRRTICRLDVGEAWSGSSGQFWSAHVKHSGAPRAKPSLRILAQRTLSAENQVRRATVLPCAVLRQTKILVEILRPSWARGSDRTARTKRHRCINEICKLAYIVYKENGARTRCSTDCRTPPANSVR
jgi:hypothetical protein